MILLKINDFTVPTNHITKYDVKFKKIYGAEEQMEDGTTYTEQIRSKIPCISVSLTNISESLANKIIEAVDTGQFNVEYYHGDMKSAQMRVTNDVSLTLKTELDGEIYFDLSFEMEG